MTWPEAAVEIAIAVIGIPAGALVLITIFGGSMPWDRKK